MLSIVLFTGMIKFGFELLPGRKILAHKRFEAFVVRGLQQMDHFMDDDVFEAARGPFGKVGVEADGGFVVVATAPTGFHAAQIEFIDLDLHDFFPFFDKGCGSSTQFFTVEALHNLMSFCNGAAGANDENDAVVC